MQVYQKNRFLRFPYGELRAARYVERTVVETDGGAEGTAVYPEGDHRGVGNNHGAHGEVVWGYRRDDETFAQLQDIYSNLVELHTTVADAVNDGTIEADAETVDLLNQAADVIKEIGDIEQTDFTDEDEALQLVDSMSKIADGLAAVAGVDAE